MDVDLLVVEPRTVARLPFVSTDNTEFRRAATCHVVAALGQLDHRGAARTPLPAFLLRDLDEAFRFRVLGALGGAVGAVVADRADFGPAGFALADFAAEGGVELDVFGFDPGAAVARWAVETVAGSVLAELVVPLGLEGVGEQFVNMAERDVFGGAAARGHVGRVGDGEGEDAL